MNIIDQAISKLQIGQAQSFRNLSLYPLVRNETVEPGYLLLDDAIEGELAHVNEVSEAGSVPELYFVNDSERDVLLLDGEELVGARQNRVLNITILVAGHSKTVIPVSCVERGRWHYRSSQFGTSKRQLYARARAQKMAHVSMSMRMDGSRRSNQSAVWESIAQKAESLSAHSPTEAMSDLYDHRQENLASFEEAFKPVENQVGAVFTINGRVLGAEVFESDAVFKKSMAKLVSSYAIDALDTPDLASEPPSLEGVRAFLAKIQGTPIESFPAIGKGEDQRLHGREINGGALVLDDRLLHLSAFAAAH